MAIKPTTQFVDYSREKENVSVPANPINTGGFRGSPITDWFKNIVDDKVKDNTDWYSQYTGNDNGGGDNGGYVDNQIVVQQPEEQVTETPVVEATTAPAVEKTTVETEVANPFAGTETQTEEKKETETSTPEIVSQDANQRNEGFINNAVGSQNAGKGKEATTTDWSDEEKRFAFKSEQAEEADRTERESQVKRYEESLPVAKYGSEGFQSLVDIAKGLWSSVSGWYNDNTTDQTLNPFEYRDGRNDQTVRVVPDSYGGADVYVLKDKDNHTSNVYDTTKGYIVTKQPEFKFVEHYDNYPNANAEPTSLNFQPDDKRLLPNPKPAITTTAVDNPINTSPDNPYTDPDWAKAYEVGLLRGNPSMEPIERPETPSNFNLGTSVNPVNDVRIIEGNAVHYVDSNGAVHSVPISSDAGQAVLDNYVNIDDSYVGYFDEEGHYHTVDLSSGRGQQIADYADAIKDDYATIEEAYAKAIDKVNEDYADTNYSPNGTQGDPIYASIMSDGVPPMTGYETEEEINYQDYILQQFVITDYDNKVNADGKEWNLVIPEGCEDIIASDKEHANDPKRNDNIETVYMSEEDYKEKVNKFIDANPQLAKLIENGKVTVDGIVANFLKALNKGNGGSGYRSGGYSGYYRGGGGGGYRGYGSSSGGSSNSAGSTTQNQQRVYNIMKNWSF